MRHLISAVLVSTATLFTLPALAAAVYLEAPAEVGPADVFNLNIEFDPAGETLGGYEFFIDYDFNKIQFNALTFGDALGGEAGSLQFYDLEAPGRISLYSVSYLPTADLQTLQNTIVNLATLSFTAFNAGVAAIQLESLAWVGGDATDLVVDSVNTEVHVTPIPAGIWLMLSGMGLMAGAARSRSRLS